MRSVAFESLLMRSEPASAQRDLGDRVEEGVCVACVTKIAEAAVRHIFEGAHGRCQGGRAEVVIQKLCNIVLGLLK